MMEEEKKKLAHLEKRLVANVDFDDQGLNLLGFSTDIYYMLGHLGWVQFSNECRQTPTRNSSWKFSLAA
jgi:hypothetical protein